MPLDILIDTGNDKETRALMLLIEDYNTIMEASKGKAAFPILNRVLLDYFGDAEVYLDELTELKQEVTQLKAFITQEGTIGFLKEFLRLIEEAETKRCTIKFVGD